jgi:hypothetical protein
MPWWRTRPERGTFTNMTSADFVTLYKDRFGTVPSYEGIAPVGAVCALCTAIERAGTLATGAVRKALEGLSLREFYADIAFANESHQAPVPMLALQYADVSITGIVNRDEWGLAPMIVAPSTSATGPLHFPMPSWAYRRCVSVGPGSTFNRSSGLPANCSNTALQTRGHCTAHGTCDCLEYVSRGSTGPHASSRAHPGWKVGNLFSASVSHLLLSCCWSTAQHGSGRAGVHTKRISRSSW